MTANLQTDREGVLRAYNKTDKDMKNDINYLNEWLEKQPHLPKITEKKLELILIRSKFDLEKTKRSIDKHFTVKNLVPELHENWDISAPQLRAALHLQAWIPLPKLTPQLDRVTVAKLLDSDPDKYDPLESFKVSMMIFEIRSESGEYNVADQMIFDMDGFKLGHLVKLTPSLIQKVLASRKSLRQSGIHILNPAPGFERLLGIAKMVMKPKLYERIHIHNDYTTLHEFIPKEVLPKDYGGDERPLEELWNEWLKEIEMKKQWLIDQSQQKSDESKRIGELNADIFGSMHGSFRKLEVD